MSSEPTPYTHVNVDCFIDGTYYSKISMQTTSSMRKLLFSNGANQQLVMMIPLNALADFQAALTNTTSTNKALLSD